MKKKVLLLICLVGYSALFAQNGKQGEVDKERYQPAKSSSKLPKTLFVIGGLSVAAGAAVTFLLPPKVSEVRYDERRGFVREEERNLSYLVAGCAAGAVCIGTGLIVKKKKSNRPKAGLTFEDIASQPPPNRDNDMRLHLVATGNGAGLRLTF